MAWPFLYFLGAKFGRLVEVPPVTSLKINLLETWLKIELQEGSEVLGEIIPIFHDGESVLKSEVFSTYEVPPRAFTGFFMCCSTKGSQVSSLISGKFIAADWLTTEDQASTVGEKGLDHATSG